MKNHPPILCFDFDNVLQNLVPGLCKVCQHITGELVLDDEWIDYDHHAGLGISTEALVNGIIDHAILEAAEFYTDVGEAIAMARSNGFNVAIVTARGYHPKGEAITRNHFDRAGIAVDHIILVGLYETKVKALQSLPNVVAYIDDYLPHLQAIGAVETELPLYLMDKTWNRHDTEFNRVSSVSEYVEQVLLAQGCSVDERSVMS